MEFSELNLHPDLQRGIQEAGYMTCMPVQEQVLTRAFGGQDLYVQSQTGTGKTAAFLIVIYQRLLTEAMLHGKKAIIMVPTRELAVQVEEEARLIGKYLPFKVGSFYGGVGYSQQIALLRDNAQILVGTPGRVLDLNQSGQMNLMEIAFLILDEADRMFDMGFYPDLRKLIMAVPPADRRQTMLFSATLNAWVKNLAWEYTRNPFEIAIEPETVTVEEVEQLLYHVASADKMKLLLGILNRENPESALVFCNTKRYAEVVAKRLRLNGFDCEFIMGDLPQSKRLKIIEDIKSGKLRLLVATDVAARGLDIEGLSLVVNYDVPNESENYVHRIGRTARAGRTGKAITLVCEQDIYGLPGIERYIGRKIPSENAVAEHFAEDRSEGRRLHTEFYEEPAGREGRSGGGRRDHAPRRDGGSRKDGDASRRDGGSRRGGDGRRDHRGGEQEKRRAGGRGGERDGCGIVPDGVPDDAKPSPDTLKLSKLPLEERMAYYRQKYDKGGSDRGGGPEKTAAPGAAREAGGKKQDVPKEAGGPKPGKPRGRRRHRREREKPARHEPAAGNSAPASRDTAPKARPPQETPKKGILSRILGVFGKK
jgi:ATP-dependent RNA helicase RhlB